MMPLTAFTAPSGVSNVTRRSFTESMLMAFICSGRGQARNNRAQKNGRVRGGTRPSYQVFRKEKGYKRKLRETLELVAEAETNNRRVDVHIGFHRGAQGGGEVDGDVAVDPDLLDVGIECPAARYAIKVVVEADLQRRTNARVIVDAVGGGAFVFTVEERGVGAFNADVKKIWINSDVTVDFTTALGAKVKADVDINPTVVGLGLGTRRRPDRN